MQTTPQQKRNRVKIVKFLRTQMPPERFDLAKIHFGVAKEGVPRLERKDCGTVGCVIGWSPAIFPNQVEFTGRTGQMCHKKAGFRLWTNIAEELYGVPANKALVLFNHTGNYTTELVPSHRCSRDATPAQVADRLEAYFTANP